MNECEAALQSRLNRIAAESEHSTKHEAPHNAPPQEPHAALRMQQESKLRPHPATNDIVPGYPVPGGKGLTESEPSIIREHKLRPIAFEQQIGRMETHEIGLSPLSCIAVNGRHPPVGKLHLLACLFNPARSSRIVRNYRIFRESLGSLPITVVELALDDDPFVATDGIRIRGTRSRHSLWQKERLLNIGLSSLPDDVGAVAWLDADVLLPDTWYADTVEALESAPIVQPFQKAHWLDERHQVERSYTSYSSWRRNQGADTYGHPGFAWAARREVLENGFFDRNIVGGGDTWMCYTFAGDLGSAWLRQAPHWMLDEWEQWASPVSQKVRGHIAWLATDLVHLHHGSPSNRSYQSRAGWMVDADLKADQIILDQNGLYTVRDNEGFRLKMIEYFPSRKDG
ncbi:hypothetical protein [Planctomicrobium piriforme]|uniref:hypothetical protein n=1 Tax=Planctomicrobium piriforme TaxID=1576369 RepID=UPI000B8438B6|nr:hypothetical protein [Planctomicrobium piriforme]